GILKSSHMHNMLRFQNPSSLDLDQNSWFFKASFNIISEAFALAESKYQTWPNFRNPNLNSPSPYE
ncbi:MAG: hypothetical protein WD355_06780, partial [Balneolaceae bacterium]